MLQNCFLVRGTGQPWRPAISRQSLTVYLGEGLRGLWLSSTLQSTPCGRNGLSHRSMSTRRFRGMQRQKKAKFYADGDIEDGAVAVLRECGVNITSARELGHRGKPDSFQAALALKEKRFLLTRNGRDYLNDRKFPLNRVHGIVVITASPRRPRCVQQRPCSTVQYSSLR